jgi:hypothetical protein
VELACDVVDVRGCVANGVIEDETWVAPVLSRKRLIPAVIFHLILTNPSKLHYFQVVFRLDLLAVEDTLIVASSYLPRGRGVSCGSIDSGLN